MMKIGNRTTGYVPGSDGSKTKRSDKQSGKTLTSQSDTKRSQGSILLNISPEGRLQLQERNVQDTDAIGMEEEPSSEADSDSIEALLEACQQQIKTSDEEADGVKDLAKIMETARRIANGDKVPYKDEKKLMEYSMKLYQTAKAAAIVNANKKHKKYKSMFKDEDNKDKDEKLRELEQEDLSEEGSATAIEENEEGESDEGDFNEGNQE